MRMTSAKAWLFAIAALGFLCASAQAETLNGGAWRVVKQADAPEYTANRPYGDGWTGIERKGGKSIIRWYWPAPDKEGGKPVKFVLLFGDPEESGTWYTSANRVKDWFDCQGEGQWEWYVECAADVCELVDLNTDGHYRLWIAIEYENGKRLYFDGKGFLTRSEYNEETKKAVSPSAVRLPEGYKWDDKNSAHKGNPTDANGKVERNGHNVVAKAKAVPYGGILIPVKSWDSARKGASKAVIHLANAFDDAVGGKPIKYILYFGSDKAKWGTDHTSINAWYECRGEGQWDWFLEVGAGVQQLMDPNDSKYRVWVAVEYESGLRRPFFGDNFPLIETYTDKTQLEDTCVKIPEGYKWPALAGGEATTPTPTPVGTGEKVNIKDKMTLWTKEGRSWTHKSTSTMKIEGMDPMVTVNYMKYTITRVTDTEAVYTLTLMDKDKNVTMEMKDQKASFLVPKPKDSDPKVEPPKTTDETIKVEAGEFECVKTEMETNGVKSVSWSDKKFLGLLIKVETKGSNLDSVMELIEWKE